MLQRGRERGSVKEARVWEVARSRARVTSLDFKSFICILIVVVILELNEILKFRYEFNANSNSDLYLNFHSNSVAIQAKWST
jgi:hypothetical protein